MNTNNLFQNDEVIFFSYLGVVTQPFISAMIDVLEKTEEEYDTVKFSQKLYILFIEMAQNIMHYTLKTQKNFKSYILIGEEENSYYVLSKNLVAKENKEKLEKVIGEIVSLDKKEIRKIYRERRKSGQNSHQKGAGIGLLDIAKVANNIEYQLTPLEEDKFVFFLKVYINK